MIATNNHQLQQILNSFSTSNNCIVGLCSADPLDTPPQSFVPFVSKNIEKRTNPGALLPGASSVFAVGCPIPMGISKEETAINATKQGPLAQLSSLGTTPDYHPVVKAMLLKLADTLHVHFAFTYKAFVDSPNLDERAFAHRAGLGFFGQNGLIISPQYGSRFNIGLLVTTIPVPPMPLPTAASSCHPNCNNCVQACPNGAIRPGLPLDIARCASYITQKRNITAEEETLLANQLYGCDICQNVCPFNKREVPTYINANTWAALSTAQFKNLYGNTAMLWQGTDILTRNGKINAKTCDMVKYSEI